MDDIFRFTPLALNRIRQHAYNRRDAATIARLMNCSPNTIENICRQHGIDLVTISDGAPPLSPYRTSDGSRVICAPLEIHVGAEAMEMIRKEAARRGVKPQTLIARVSEIVAMDNIFAAVLDK